MATGTQVRDPAYVRSSMCLPTKTVQVKIPFYPALIVHSIHMKVVLHTEAHCIYGYMYPFFSLIHLEAQCTQ